MFRDNNSHRQPVRRDAAGDATDAGGPSPFDAAPVAIEAGALRRARWSVAVAISLLLVAPVAAWLVPGLTERFIEPAARGAGRDGELGLGLRLAGLGLSLVPALPIGFGLAQVWRFCGHAAAGAAFTLRAVRCIARLGWSLLVSAALMPLARLAILRLLRGPEETAWLSGIFAPGRVMLTFVALGLGVLALAAVLRAAVRLADENARFV